jgi:hypothetical protein
VETENIFPREAEAMTCLKHLDFTNPKTLTFAQLIQMACELELEINKVNRQSRDMRVKKALENASEHIPHIVEWLITAKKDSECISRTLMKECGCYLPDKNLLKNKHI